MFKQKKWGMTPGRALATLVTGLVAGVLGPFGLEAATKKQVSSQPGIVVSRKRGLGAPSLCGIG